MRTLGAVVVYPVQHPDLYVRRYGTPPSEPQTAKCWEPVIGEHPVRLLRELALQWDRRPGEPVVEHPGQLAEWLGFGVGTPATDQLWMAMERLVAWHLAEVCPSPGHFRVYRQLYVPEEVDREVPWLERVQVIRARLANAFLDHRLTPAELGLDEVVLRYVGSGPIVDRSSGYGDACALVVRRISADGTAHPDAPHCPDLSGHATATDVLDGIGGSYTRSGTGPVRRFEEVEREPELLLYSRAALAGLGELTLTADPAAPQAGGSAHEAAKPHDPVHAAARMAWRLGQVEMHASAVPDLSL